MRGAETFRNQHNKKNKDAKMIRRASLAATRTLTHSATPARQLLTMRIALHAKSTSAAAPPPPPPPPTPSRPTVAQIFAQYGAIGMGVYGSISFAGFAALYASMATGLLDTSWVLTMVRSYVDVEAYTGINLDTLNPMYSNFALAYLANFFLEPVRIVGTVYFTPKLGRWWTERRQLMQQQQPQQQMPVGFNQQQSQQSQSKKQQ